MLFSPLVTCVTTKPPQASRGSLSGLDTGTPLASLGRRGFAFTLSCRSLAVRTKWLEERRNCSLPLRSCKANGFSTFKAFRRILCPLRIAWKIPWTGEPGRLQSMGSLRVGQTERLHFHFSLSCIGGGNGNPLQCSCLENPRDCGAWWAAVYGVAQSRTRLKRLSSSSSSGKTKYHNTVTISRFVNILVSFSLNICC